MTRKQEREIVFKLLYQMQLCDMDAASAKESLLANIDESYMKDGSHVTAQDIVQSGYINATLEGVTPAIAEIDSKISPLAKNWSLERITALSLTALRYGMYELDQKTIPTSVVINEVTDLIATYEGEEAANFVNGILGTYSRQ